MDLRTLTDAIPVISLVANGVAVWAAWSLRQLAKAEVTKIVTEATAGLAESVKGAVTRLDDAESRLDKYEVRFETVATKEDLARVTGKIDAVGNNVDEVKAVARRLEGYFLQRGVERAE